MRVQLEVTTDGDGDGAATEALPFGKAYQLVAVDWIDGNLADGVDGVLACILRPFGGDMTLLTLTDANADAMYRPLVEAHDVAGDALDTGVDTTYRQQIVDGSLRLTIAAGGAAKTGGCVCYLREL